MPVNPTYPGVYIEEVPSGVHAITGVSTSVTAFVGRALRGPTDRPRRVQSFAEYARVYGGLWRDSTMSYAVQQYFQNGGRDAVIARIHHNAAAATLPLPGGLNLAAASQGKWGEKLRVRVEHPPGSANTVFNLSIKDTDPQSTTVERFLNVSTDPNHPRFVTAVLEQQSFLVRATAVPQLRPNAHPNPPPGTDPLDDANASTGFGANGDDGGDLVDADISAANLELPKQGLWLLEHEPIFNLLCIPPLARGTDVGKVTWDAALGYVKKRRAFLIVDAPAAWTQTAHATAAGAITNVVTRSPDAALYFPRLRIPDPANDNRLADFAPCGTVAGIYARTDAERGVWKAPAGIQATLLGVSDLTTNLTDGENGQLNPLAVNCLRTFPAAGRVAWGSRTLFGADQLASEWKYVPIRRLALFIEQSLYEGTQWVVFEPNDEPLWAQIRMNVGAFMQRLFRQGAFEGATPRLAYFVRCDRETTTAADANLGVVNIVVGFAPLKPAEFVIIKITQIIRADV